MGMTAEPRQIALFFFFFNLSVFIQPCLFYAEGVLHAANSQIFSLTAAGKKKKISAIQNDEEPQKHNLIYEFSNGARRSSR